MAKPTPISDREYLLERMERYLRTPPTADPSPAQSTPTEAAPLPSLTISRQCGVRFSRLERPLLEYLDGLRGSTTRSWALFDQSLLGRVVENRRLPGHVVPFLSECSKFPFTAVLRERLAMPREDWTLFNHSTNAIRQFCRTGHAIIVGRAGNFVTSDLDNTFHVRLIAEKGRRVDYVSRRYQIDSKEASELVEETDKARAGFVRRHTGSDIDDPVAYHFVLNTDFFEDEVLVSVIADSLHEWSQIRASKPAFADESPEDGKLIDGGFTYSPG